MSEQAGMPGELIYEHAVQIKQVTEYGVAFDGLLSGAPGPSCVRRAPDPDDFVASLLGEGA
jgi:hypothetical protein